VDSLLPLSTVHCLLPLLPCHALHPGDGWLMCVGYGRAQVKCTDKCKCEDCKNVSLRGPDETPGERQRSEAALRGLLQLSGSKASLSPDERASLTAHKRHDDTLSASRNKKPRVLDFNVLATTPSHSTPSAPMRLVPAPSTAPPPPCSLCAPFVFYVAGVHDIGATKRLCRHRRPCRGVATLFTHHLKHTTLFERHDTIRYRC